jgi:hypothetical protein
VNDAPLDELLPGIPEAVIKRLQTELGPRAEKVLSRLRTAAALVAQAEADSRGLRFAESAGYNLREALNQITEGQSAVEGGLGTVVDAWKKFKDQTAMPGVDAVAARDELDQVLSAVAADESRASYNTRRMVGYLQRRAGAPTLGLPGDPVTEYAALRDRANSAVHGRLSLAEAEALLTLTTAWFVRMFTPPDQVTDAIRALAAQPWVGQEQIAELKQLAVVDHHLRLFLSEITDPAWLDPLLRARLVRLPAGDGPWPVTALLGGLGRTDPEAVEGLLELLLAEAATIPKPERAAARFELLRMAVLLNPPASGVAVEVVRLHSDLMSVRSLGVDAALKAAADDPAVLAVANATLNHFRRFSDGNSYYSTKILEHLQAGVTEDNVADRAQMLAAKARRLAQSDEARWVPLGIEALTASPGEHPDPFLLFAHHLALALTKARRWQVPTSQQLEWLEGIQGEAGERLLGHALAGASDVTVADKIAHITRRLSSPTATAEDLELVTDIMSHVPARDDLAAWPEALGTPTPAPAADTGEQQIPREWARAWRWAMVLPASVLTAWQDAINYVSGFHGAPDPQILTGDRAPQMAARWGQSPYSTDELSAGAPLEAAAMVSAWEPDAESDRQMMGRTELARALEGAVKANPAGWSAAPQDVATALRHPLYVEHYFRGLTEHAADIVPQAPAVLAAALAQLHEGESWQEVVLGLARALANKDGDLAASLNVLWERALTAVRSAPEADTGLLFTGKDPFASAPSRTWGHGLQTVVALAAWEYRHNGTVRAEFEHTLNNVIETTGPAGLELRAILAASRPLLETIAATWLKEHAAPLFREGPWAQETFDLTLKWAQPTTWLYQEFTDELFDAALRGAENATRLIAVAALHEEKSYDLTAIIKRLAKNTGALAAATEDTAFLVQGAEPGSPRLTVAIRFWTLLLDTSKPEIPTAALSGLGRWAFVESIDDDQWAYLTARTIDATGGSISYPVSVADRAVRTPASTTSRAILLRLLDSGDPWERHHAATKALEVLRACSTQPADDTLQRLRTRLIDLGNYDAATINPPDKPD